LLPKKEAAVVTLVVVVVVATGTFLWCPLELPMLLDKVEGLALDSTPVVVVVVDRFVMAGVS